MSDTAQGLGERVALSEIQRLFVRHSSEFRCTGLHAWLPILTTLLPLGLPPTGRTELGSIPDWCNSVHCLQLRSSH